ncbi:MAG: hypothetical protein KF859_05820 [Phycisphaeraceae bacterium]|nr:hypothetical protein [Phycisphaeraceae bacterium]
MKPTLLVIAAATCLLAPVAGLVGCTKQYTNYPEVPTARGLSEDPNSPAAELAIISSVQFVVRRYFPGSQQEESTTTQSVGRASVQDSFVLNLPRGMRKSFYERIARQIGPNVMPMTEEAQQTALPVFYVTRVWMRFNQGQVDIMRPMLELPPGPDGKPIYQTITCRLEGRFMNWRVVHARAWTPGLDPLPQPYFVPDIERTDQFRHTMRLEAMPEGEAPMNEPAFQWYRPGSMDDQPAQPSQADGPVVELE